MRKKSSPKIFFVLDKHSIRFVPVFTKSCYEILRPFFAQRLFYFTFTEFGLMPNHFVVLEDIY